MINLEDNIKKIVVVASNNYHKIKEIKEILTEYTIVALKDIGFSDEIEETGTTFKENALIKANAIHTYLKKSGKEYLVLADDSGLCVDSLDGAPGVYSARYAGIHGNEQANRDKLLKELEGKDRTAHFNCTIAIIYPNGDSRIFEGKTFGRITTEERGKKDFGYDCLFYSNDLKKTFGEATEKEKNSVSHRARALERIKKELL
ncbi:MAG: RdgB/HAM1 family non-canonical purine NTP pyrophosphatase [Clostridia bacterium]|nr:RdgB/HAM1 family non-canonical purine NTP pyrophosphatase [Clostridia bacterium]